MSTSNFAIRTQNLSRSYRSYEKNPGLWGSIQGIWNRKYTEKMALSPTSLEIEPGQIIGLVGANGAGKTTLIKVLSGLIVPSGGEAQVLGFSPWKREYKFLKQMTVLLGQKNQLWWDISPNDSYSLLADIYDLDRARAFARVNELAEILDCKSVLKTQLRRLSLGERMKMEIIGCLIHEPKILFLDEPTIGLDIVAQNSIRRFLSEYVAEKKPTVILTSHYMDDIASLADRLLLISKGQIVYDGTVDGFSQKSTRKQKVFFTLGAPLAHQLVLAGSEFAAGTLEFSVEVTTEELPLTMNKITSMASVKDLRLEQVDFEQVIHEFMRGQ